jgi:endonuclease-3 related protein
MNKLKEIYEILLKTYGSQGWWPINNKYHKDDYSLPKNKEQEFEIILGAILTQSTSWKNVEKTLNVLRKNNLLSKGAIERLSEKKLALLIKSSGYNNQKAKKIKEYLKFDKEITRENLLSTWGFGPETVDSILLYAYKKPVFVIDTYTKRIFSRLGFIKETNSYDKIQELFHYKLERDYKLFNEFHALIVEHAKQHCKKRPECEDCCLNEICKNHIMIGL